MDRSKVRTALALAAMALVLLQASCTGRGGAAPTPTQAEAMHGPYDVVLFGDSIVYLGGDACDSPRGWSHTFAGEFADSLRSIRSYARSGATLSHTPETRADTAYDTGVLDPVNVVYNQVLRLREDYAAGRVPAPDILLIGAGINDVWFLQHRPGALDETVDAAYSRDIVTDPAAATTVASALRMDIAMLRETFPNIRIVLLTPAQSTKVSEDRLSRVSEIISGVARREGAGIIRLDCGGAIYAARESRELFATYDGTHPSVEGAALTGRFIAERLRGILAATPATTPGP